jgi:metallophosphoesterase (TIGR03767 family)
MRTNVCLRGATARVLVLSSIALVACTGVAGAASNDPTGKTTVQQRIVPNSNAGFRFLTVTGAGEPYVLREEGVGTAQAGRATRRDSLAYFGQLSDFQLADEESPARVEFIDYGPFSAAWRPSEALNPQIDNQMVRQINTFTAASPVADGAGVRSAMDLVINTGDAADSQQLNETEWVRTLMEGGTLNPGSGVAPAVSGNPVCAALAPLIADRLAPQRYTGIQDYDDYFEGPAPQFYDPDAPLGAFATWPRWPNLMDVAQRPFNAVGLHVPSYITFGNHDGLVQGNAAANAAYEAVATGCIKPMSPLVTDPDTLQAGLGALNQQTLLGMLSTQPQNVALVPPDPKRQYVSKKQYKQVFRSGSQTDGHGFDFVDPAEEAASNGTAGYYSWSPKPGVRFISLDTVSEAGVIGPSADGNIDDPQYRWLEGELQDATDADELVILFSHHAIPSLTANVPDELAPPCTVADPHGHDVNPGCDLDPRSSQPIHLGADMEALLYRYPNAIAWVAGHSHVNAVEPHPNPSGDGGFWSVRVAAEADWPQQTRLLELFDNEDGTLSLFGTIIDHASQATSVAPGTNANVLGVKPLASLGRTIGYNDRQSGGRACGGGPCGEGTVNDRNVELLIDDPR